MEYSPNVFTEYTPDAITTTTTFEPNVVFKPTGAFEPSTNTFKPNVVFKPNLTFEPNVEIDPNVTFEPSTNTFKPNIVFEPFIVKTAKYSDYDTNNIVKSVFITRAKSDEEGKMVLLNFESDDTFMPLPMLPETYNNLFDKIYNECGIMYDIEPLYRSNLPDKVIEKCVGNHFPIAEKEMFTNEYLPTLIEIDAAEERLKALTNKFKRTTKDEPSVKKNCPNGSNCGWTQIKTKCQPLYELRSAPVEFAPDDEEVSIGLPVSGKAPEPYIPPLCDILSITPCTCSNSNSNRDNTDTYVRCVCSKKLSAQKNETKENKDKKIAKIASMGIKIPSILVNSLDKPVKNQVVPNDNTCGFQYSTYSDVEKVKIPVIHYRIQVYINTNELITFTRTSEIYNGINSKYIPLQKNVENDMDEIEDAFEKYPEYGFCELFTYNTTNLACIEFIDTVFKRHMFMSINEMNEQFIAIGKYIEYLLGESKIKEEFKTEDMVVREIMDENFCIDDNIEHRMKAQEIYDFFVENKCAVPGIKIDTQFRNRLSKYLISMGLKKKRYSDGYYYYGIKRGGKMPFKMCTNQETRPKKKTTETETETEI